MMKKLHFLFALMVASATAFAQRSADLELISTSIGTSLSNLQPISPYDTVLVDDSTQYFIQWTMANNGPDTIRSTDSLRIKTFLNIVYKGSIVIPPGDTVSLIPAPSPIKFKAPGNAPTPYIDTLIWCDSIWVVAAQFNTPISDPLISNNHSCQSITAYALKVSNGINDLADKQALRLYPNPATDKLNIDINLGSDVQRARVVLRNLVGVQVYNHLLENTSGNTSHSIDVGHLPKGLYLAELQYNEQTIVQKLSIQ